MMRVPRYEIQSALAILKRAVSPLKSTVTANILATSAPGGRLRLVATDLDVAAMADIVEADGSEGEFESEVLVPADPFYNLVRGARKSSGEAMTIAGTPDQGVELEVGGISTSIFADADPGDYPVVPPPGSQEVIESIGAEKGAIPRVREALDYVLPAVSDDETRPNICRVLFDFQDDRVVTTDGHRMHLAPLPLAARESPGKACPRVTVPRGLVDLIRRACAHAEGTDWAVFMIRGEGSFKYLQAHLGVTTQWTLMAPVFDEYPDYTVMLGLDSIGPNARNQCRVDRKKLSEVCKRMIRVHENPQEPAATLWVTREGVEVENQGSPRAVTKLPGEAISVGKRDHAIAINLKYLDEALQVKRPEAVLAFEDDLSPMGVSYGDGFQGIVMPRRMP